MDKGLAEFQHQNCKDCRFADKPKVGTGEPCCTYCQQIESDGKLCFSWKADAQTNARVQKARKLVNRVMTRI